MNKSNMPAVILATLAIMPYNDTLSEKNEKTKKENLLLNTLSDPAIQFTQYLSNDLVFWGLSLYGDNFARRNNKKYSGFSKSYTISSSVDLLGLPKGLDVGFILITPVVGRTNTDSDGYFQSTSGGQDQTDLINQSLQNGSLQFDPTFVRLRKEKNRLVDLFLSKASYEYQSHLGAIAISLLFINSDDPSNVMRGYYTLGWKLPIAKYLNPAVTATTKMFAEYNGNFHGNKNIRIWFHHKYRKGKSFRFTPSINLGYTDVNNNIERKKGVSDISLKSQFELYNYFFSINYTYRPDLKLYDSRFIYPDPESNNDSSDRKVLDPSRVNGPINQYITNYIYSVSPNQFVQTILIKSYQQQRIPHGIFYINIGYSIKI